MTVGTLSINLNAIKENWKTLDRLTAPNVETGAVLKANAYGLGIDKVSAVLKSVGTKEFFVASISESIQLRKLLNNNAKIYCLNGYTTSDAKDIRSYDIIPVLNSTEQLIDFKNCFDTKSFAIQVEIGMNRLGFSLSEVKDFKTELDEGPLDLIIGHLSSANVTSAQETKKQLAIFKSVQKIISNKRFSLSASAGLMLGTEYHYDLTRPGIALFAGLKFPGSRNVVDLSLPVIQIKTVPPNQGIGYNHTYKTREKKTIAVLSGGYADGLLRSLGNNGNLYFGNIPCPVLGRVSMDLITVDITHLKTRPKNLCVLNESQTLDILAKSAETISYEILTNLGTRYNRIYNGSDV